VKNINMVALLRSGAAPVILAMALVSPSIAHAQNESERAGETSQSGYDGGSIIVTGTRTVSPVFQEIQPTLVIDKGQIGRRAYTNIASALTDLPSFGLSDQNGTDDQGASGVGAHFTNFFGLGSQRTLTVVNGRRFVGSNAPSLSPFNAAGGLQVDLNLIPAGLVERVETIAVTGAPIYGADAIAGTVNVILKRDYEGLELTTSYGVSQRGDMDEYQIRGLAGRNFADDRGNITLSFDYNKRAGLIKADRKPYRDAYSFQPNPANTGPADGMADRVLIKDARLYFATFDGLPSFLFGNPFFGAPVSNAAGDILQFAPDGDLVPYNPGTPYGPAFASGGDGVNLAELGNLITPSRRILFNALARYEITQGAELYTELFYANTRANDQVSQAVWNTDLLSGADAALPFSADNPFLTDQARFIITQNCANSGIPFLAANCNFLLSRNGRAVAAGNNESTQNLYRIVGGVRGDFELADRRLSYDLSFNYGRTEDRSSRDDLNNRRFGLALDAVGLTAGDVSAVGASDRFNIVRGGSVMMDVAGASLMAGDIACAATVNRSLLAGAGDDPGGDIGQCVPLNYFGAANTSAEARAYVNMPFTSKSFVEQKVFDANVHGALFDMPAGEALFSLGYHHREEKAAFRPDSAYLMGLGRVPPILATAGGFNTDEFAAELILPILGEGMTPLVSSLVVQGAARYVDNNRAGNDWTYTLGGALGMWEEQVKFRGNYTKSIRSPALVELFLPRSATISTANDPCDASNILGGPDPDVRQANCLADAQAHGLSAADMANFQSRVVNATRQGITGGNPGLDNEIARSFTLGVVVQPKAIRNFSVAVDYVNIELTGAISSLDLVDVMNACYDSPGFPNEYCGRFERTAAGNPLGGFQVIDGFQTGYVNAGSQDFEAITVEFAYSRGLNDIFTSASGNLGSLQVTGSLFHLLTDERSVTGFDFDDRRGQISRSNWRGQLNVAWVHDRVDALIQTRYIGPARFDNDDSAEARDLLKVGDYWLVNAALGFRPTQELELRLNVDNVFDSEGPYGVYASANSYYYDFIGRYYRMTVKLAF